jgi:hypothetical protein
MVALREVRAPPLLKRSYVPAKGYSPFCTLLFVLTTLLSHAHHHAPFLHFFKVLKQILLPSYQNMNKFSLKTPLSKLDQKK